MNDPLKNGQVGAPGLATMLATRVTSLRWADLPPAAIAWAKVGILDTVGVTLAGCRDDAARMAALALDDSLGASVVFGLGVRRGALDAALLNGTASHALDFDDCNNTMGGHPSAPVLSALFPLADELGSSGRDFILAYIAGFEVETKLAMAVNFHHYTKGWHPTATLGVFGAAAACARLLGLDSAQTATALALAASFASGIKANFGTMAKPLHVGHCARNGLLAARLAAGGFTANAADVFEHTQGFLDVFNGPGTYDCARALSAWGAPFDIVTPGIAIKQYPCCGSTHPAIDAMLMLVREHAPAIADVARVEAWVHERRLKHTDRPAPQSALDGKFSVQYVLARALLGGQVTVQDFEGDAHQDEDVRALLPRIAVAPYDATQFSADNHFAGAVRLTMRDGTQHRAQVDQALGRTSSNPLPKHLLHAKFALCAAQVLRHEAIAPILETIETLEDVGDVRELSTRILAGTINHGEHYEHRN